MAANTCNNRLICMRLLCCVFSYTVVHISDYMATYFVSLPLIQEDDTFVCSYTSYAALLNSPSCMAIHDYAK